MIFIEIAILNINYDYHFLQLKEKTMKIKCDFFQQAFFIFF